METTRAQWTQHPGYYIKEEMEARDWNQRDLAFVLGVPDQAVNMILTGKRGISSEMAKSLGNAFDVSPEFFSNLQRSYDMSRAQEADPGIVIRGKMQSVFPVREMINRNWIQSSDPALLESQLANFFQVSSAGEIPYLAHAALKKQSHYETREMHPQQLAWLFRVRQIARSVRVPKYSESALRRALEEFRPILLDPMESRHVSRLLSACGVRFILVESLPHADIDGVCFWIDDSPVIGMSLRRDTVGNFWFVLLHEIEHILRGHGKSEEIIDVDLSGADGSTVAGELPEEERQANLAAANFCVPTDKLDSFLARKHPYYYEKDVVAFAQLHGRHVGLVVGQMQRRLNDYKYLHRHLAKIRTHVLSGALADGWGQQIPTQE